MMSPSDRDSVQVSGHDHDGIDIVRITIYVLKCDRGIDCLLDRLTL